VKNTQKITGGQAVVHSLKKEKIKHVFGLIGSATMEIFDSLYQEKEINFIGVRDERDLFQQKIKFKMLSKELTSNLYLNQ